MKRNEREGYYYGKPAFLYLAPAILSSLFLASICSDQGNVNPVSLGGPVPQPTPDLLAFRGGSQCREIMEDIEGAYNKSGLAPYDGKYYLISNPLVDGTALRVLVLTSKEKFEKEVDNFEEKLRERLSVTGVDYFPVKYFLVAKKIEGGGAIVDESIESIIRGKRGVGPGCFASPAPAAPAASPSS